MSFVHATEGASDHYSWFTNECNIGHTSMVNVFMACENLHVDDHYDHDDDDDDEDDDGDDQSIVQLNYHDNENDSSSPTSPNSINRHHHQPHHHRCHGEEKEPPPSSPSSPTPSQMLNFEPIYAASRRSVYSYSRSLSSIDSDWSTTTMKVSNTISAVHCKTQGDRYKSNSNDQQRQQHQKNRKRRFLQFTKVLMKLLERKDPIVYNNAHRVIQQCEQKKRRGETKSITQDLRAPLKQVVGYNYWHQARNEVSIMSQRRHHGKNGFIEQKCCSDTSITNCSHGRSSTFDCQHSKIHLNPISGSTLTADPTKGDPTDVGIVSNTSFRCPYDVESSSSTRPAASSYNSSFKLTPQDEEIRLRKKRQWMIISVLMKYLQHNDDYLYQQARLVVSDCLMRHRNHEDGYRSLSGCIQNALKREVGSFHWHRAESYIHKRLILQEGEVQGQGGERRPRGHKGDAGQSLRSIEERYTGILHHKLSRKRKGSMGTDVGWK